jgi:iron uptake system EfeUOB component EfeO/EfeM
MLSKNAATRAVAGAVAALALVVALVVALTHGGSPRRSAAATVPNRAPVTTAAVTPVASAAGSVGSSYGPPPLAHYSELSPHVTSRLNIYGLQGQVQGESATPPDELGRVSPSSFRAPVAAYRTYSVGRLRLMQGEIAKLQAALAAGDRAAAQTAWLGAYGYYLNLGAVYLEGPISDLNDAIDGTPGGVPGGVSSPQFSGLHRLEHGLWTGESLPSLEPWARKLAADVTKLDKLVPTVQIDPLDYATRAHEILEDAVRDQLSGTDAPWSGAGVLGTSAGLVATTEVVKTLAPMLGTREAVLPVVNADLSGLRSTLAAIADAHGGSLPTTAALTQLQSERLSGSLGEALEGLAQVPGALETTPTPTTPQIPAADVKIDP